MKCTSFGEFRFRQGRSWPNTSFVVASVIALFLGSSPPRLWGQAFYGSLVGIVTDTTGAVVPGAQVILTDVATAGTRIAVTSDTGSYQFVNLVPGNYQIDVEGKG
jgi:hypothetical protein